MPSLRKTLVKVAIYAGLVMGALMVVGPFLWMLSTSLMKIEQIYVFPPKWLPDPVQWHNYAKVFTIIPLGRFFLNTIVVSISVIVLRLLVTTLCAYALARLHFPGRDLFFLAMVATMIIPGEVQLIPGFVADGNGFGDLQNLFVNVPRVVEDPSPVNFAFCSVVAYPLFGMRFHEALAGSVIRIDQSLKQIVVLLGTLLIVIMLP